MDPILTQTLNTSVEFLAPLTPYIALFALLAAIFSLMQGMLLRRRFAKLMLGRNGNLEETISILTRDTRELQTFRKELEKYLKIAEARMRNSVQGVGMVRFNPFIGDGSGGNQSFSIALLDESHSGVVLSTLYARDRVGVYAKPVENSTSTFELTQEERDAIEKAKKSIQDGKK